ncbi:HAD-IIA family hydrolase [Nocardioides ginsengisoli]|uniref:HAD-IIA family hydrolase n=1 Tax=Nocardioides ginsengisoli TaxID=363868 RepID=A0ABW3W1L2_9ACTN
MLVTSSAPLTRAYDLAMLDLDGVVYVGPHAVDGAAEGIAAAREAGMRVAFITNNAARSPDAVAAHLTELGVPAQAHDVVTSAQAAARLARDRWGAGARVVAVGGPGLWTALREAGLEPVGAADEAVAVVTGYGPDVVWHDLTRVAVRIRDGLPWVASNTDYSMPTAYGVAPGHGVQVEMLSRFSAVTPDVAGKPERPLLDETVRRIGGERPLMVGDRLDTDIEGARKAGFDSLLVLTGVTGLAELVAARDELRPTYLATDLGGLCVAHQAPERRDGAWVLGGWSATCDGGRLVVRRVAAGGGDGAEPAAGDWWRVVATAAWSHLDATGEPADVTGVDVPDVADAGEGADAVDA